MIQKPSGDWQRGVTPLANVVENATSMARGGARVARTGGHTLRGLLCWGFALLWGFAALAAGASGSLPTFVGVGLMAAGMAWAGNRAFAKARGVLTDARTPEEVSADASREVHYSRTKLGQAMGGGVILSWLASFLVHSAGGMALMLIYVAMIGGVLFSILAGIKLCGDRLALRWDAQAITVGTLWKRRTVRREDIIAIKLSTITTYAMGVIRTGRTTTLTLRTRNAGSLGVTLRLLELNDRTGEHLAIELDRWRGGVASRQAIAPTPAFGKVRTARTAEIAYPETEGAFDADAIMARYLAEKTALEAHAKLAEPTAGETPMAPSRQRSFGRRITGQPSGPVSGASNAN